MAEKSWKRATLFELPQVDIPSPLSIKKELSQITDVRKVSTKKSVASLPLERKLEVIRQSVYSILGRYKGFVRVIRNEKELSDYIDAAIQKGIGCLDTETNNSLDPITCKIMGVCLYYPNSRPVYVPMNHTIPGTDIRLEGQIDESFMEQMIRRLKESGIKVIYHNGKFDLRVLYNTLGLYPPIWWDTMIAAQLLNEDEVAKLKNQYRMHINPTMSPYEIEKLFLGVPYAWIDIELFALYAAIDAYDTYRLYEYQKEQFEQEGMERLYNLFLNIEMPVVTISAQMEDAGVCVERNFLSRMDAKCRSERDKHLKELIGTLSPYESEIKAYQLKGKLSTPINFDSSSQLQLVLYDIMKAPILSEDGKKSTKKETLEALKLPFTKTLLKYRKSSKLIDAFTTPLPNWLSPKDGKLHASFNQLGKEDNNVRTGRFSSTDPNLQQIPHNDLRMVFKASPQCAIVGADFSQQEPRILTHITQDKRLLETYQSKKDLYATIGSFMFHKSYWECMEKHEDGSPNPVGKKLRSQCKTIVLGILYGMGPKRLADNLGISIDECRETLDKFFQTFPTIKAFTEQNERDAIEKGYVEDYMGRRRHLPDASLPELVAIVKHPIKTDADIFFECSPKECIVEVENKEESDKWNALWKEAEKTGRFSAKKRFKEQAAKQGISIKDNGSFIAKTRTQCTNSRIQGSAATLTKKAMIKIANDPLINELGYKILIPVHDELLGECPKENAERVEKRLAELMIEAGKPECSVPMKVDTYVVNHWYQDEVYNSIYSQFRGLISGDNHISSEEAVKKLQDQYPEISPRVVQNMCYENYDVLSEEI